MLQFKCANYLKNLGKSHFVFCAILIALLCRHSDTDLSTANVQVQGIVMF